MAVHGWGFAGAPKSVSVRREKECSESGTVRKENSRNQKRLCDSHATHDSVPLRHHANSMPSQTRFQSRGECERDAGQDESEQRSAKEIAQE